MLDQDQTRRDFLRHIGVGITALSIPAFLKCASPGNHPNILLILSDDAGYDDFGFQVGTDIPTPNLDRLAADGVIFTDAHVTATVCSPSRAGIMTGRYQQRFGHEANAPAQHLGMDLSEITLADALKQLNYRTGIFGKWHLGVTEPYHPNSRGFDEFFGILGGSRSYFFSEERNRKPGGKQILHNREPASFEGYFTDVLTDKAIEFIEAEKNQPFFVFLSYTAVHTPMHAKEEDLALFKDHPRPVLAAMTHAMDKGVGRVIASLERTNQLDNTLIIFTNDNGGSAFNTSSNAPLKGWKGNKYEGGSRVPFVFYWKNRIQGGRHFNGITSTLDIFVTALACAGGRDHGGKPLDGVDLIPYLNEGKKGNPHNMLFWRKEEEAAVRWKEWKLIRLKEYGFVLYNLKENLGETENLIEKHPDIFRKMKEALEAWELELVEPAWHEDQNWRDVTWQIHKGLMENKKPGRIHP